MKKFNLKNIGSAAVALVFVFLMCLENITDISVVKTLLRYSDEMFTLLCMVYLLRHIHFVCKHKAIIICLWIVFLAIGVISSLVYQYQSPVISAVDGFLIISKFIIGYLTAYVYGKLHADDLCEKGTGAIRIVTVLLFLLMLHDMIFTLTPIFPQGEFRYFTNSVQLMFPHTTYCAAAMATILIFLGYTNKNGGNIPYMILATIIGMLTFRSKALAFFAIYWMLYICLVVFRFRNVFVLLGIGGLSGVVIGMEQIVLYFFTRSHYSPRNIMLKDSVGLADSHFPFGTGFGTFGSTLAAQHYSPLYRQLGYENLDGMKSTDTKYLTDCFWPEIVAQFGWIGTLVFVLLVVLLLNLAIKKMKKSLFAGYGMLAIMVLMLINSMAESSFFNPTSLFLFILFGLFETRPDTRNLSPEKI